MRGFGCLAVGLPELDEWTPNTAPSGEEFDEAEVLRRDLSSDVWHTLRSKPFEGTVPSMALIVSLCRPGTVDIDDVRVLRLPSILQEVREVCHFVARARLQV